MPITTHELAQRDFERLEKEIRELEKRLKPLPEGTLSVYTVRGYRRFYQIVRDPKTHKRVRMYISTFDKTKIKQLVDKTVYLAELKDKKEEYQCLKSFLNAYESKLQRMQSRLVNVKEIREMSDYMPPLLKRIQEWEAEEYPTNSYPKMTAVKSVLGIDVRSKSEAYIASRLKEKGLAVRYECELKLPHGVIYPDFTILDPRSGRIYYWEHLGMMDDEEYAKHATRKIDDYAEAGYLPMLNLILTSETKERPLDFGLVDHLIEYYFA